MLTCTIDNHEADRTLHVSVEDDKFEVVCSHCGAIYSSADYKLSKHDDERVEFEFPTNDNIFFLKEKKCHKCGGKVFIKEIKADSTTRLALCGIIGVTALTLVVLFALSRKR